MGKNFLQLASRKTNVLTLGEDGTGELIVRADVSKGAFRALLAKMPEDISEDNTTFTAVEADDFTTGLFGTLVVGWNATDDNGNPVDATVENYLELPREVASVVDTALLEYFNGLTVKEDEKSKSKETSGGVGEV